MFRVFVLLIILFLPITVFFFWSYRLIVTIKDFSSLSSFSRVCWVLSRVFFVVYTLFVAIFYAVFFHP